MLCVVIDSTYDVVIDVDAAKCFGASNLKSGMPNPPYAGLNVTSWRISLERDSILPNNVGRSKSSIASWIGSTQSSDDSIVCMKHRRN